MFQLNFVRIWLVFSLSYTVSLPFPILCYQNVAGKSQLQQFTGDPGCHDVQHLKTLSVGRLHNTRLFEYPYLRCTRKDHSSFRNIYSMLIQVLKTDHSDTGQSVESGKLNCIDRRIMMEKLKHGRPDQEIGLAALF